MNVCHIFIEDYYNLMNIKVDTAGSCCIVTDDRYNPTIYYAAIYNSEYGVIYGKITSTI